MAQLGEVPYALPQPIQAVILDANRPEVLLDIKRRVKALHVLIAVLHPGRGIQFRAVIARGDGAALPLRWETGKNIGPSMGPWDGTLANDTHVAWEAGDRSARLFSTTWENGNEWLPVQQIKFTLEDEAATILILGVSALSID